MGRWLAPRLPGPQHWILHDRDPGLLARAAAAPRHGRRRRVETRDRATLTALTAADLAGTSLVTAPRCSTCSPPTRSTAIAAALRRPGRPALLTLSVVGRM